MKVTSLSSGSSGNCYLVQHGTTNILIDSGLSAGDVQKYLAERGLAVTDLSAVFLTHDHSDHLRSAGTLSRKWGIPVMANELTLKAARYKWEKITRLEEKRAVQLGETPTPASAKFNLKEMKVGDAWSSGGLEVSSIPVSHDAADTVCYTFRADNHQGMILTDLGCATEPIFEPLYHSDLIILEANHELNKLQTSGYPAALRARIASDRGHLSNEQSARILQQVLEYSGLHHTVWLAHLSEDTNNPKNALKYVGNHLDQIGIRNFPLQVALRDKPSLSWQGRDQLFQAQMLFDF